LSTVMVRGFTVCGCPKALRKKRFAVSTAVGFQASAAE
jgi:hypothetical protein